MFGVNLLVVLMAGAIGGCLNIIWYSKLGCGRWLRTRTEKERAGADRITKGYQVVLAAFATELVIAFAIAYLVALTGSYSFSTLLELVLWVWVGFSAAVLLQPVFREGQTWAVYFVNVGYRFISWMAMGLAIICFAKLF